MEWKNFVPDLTSNVTAGVILGIIAYLARNSIAKYLTSIFSPKPDLKLLFSNRSDCLSVGPYTPAQDYDFSVDLVVQNSSNVVLQKDESSLHLFLPKNFARKFGCIINQNVNETESDDEFKHLIIPIEQNLNYGFTDLSNFAYNFRLLKPKGDRFKVYYYFQTPFGYFPANLEVKNGKENPLSGGALTYILSDWNPIANQNE